MMGHYVFATLGRSSDLAVTGAGFYCIEPLTDGGHRWLRRHCDFEPWQWLSGGMTLDDSRLVNDIIDGAINDGLRVDVHRG